MGTDDKFRNKAEEVGGKAKEGLGRVTGDEEMTAEGKADQGKSKMKQAGEKVKDAAKGAKDAIKGD
jgi:CsbD-like.